MTAWAIDNQVFRFALWFDARTSVRTKQGKPKYDPGVLLRDATVRWRGKRKGKRQITKVSDLAAALNIPLPTPPRPVPPG